MCDRDNRTGTRPRCQGFRSLSSLAVCVAVSLLATTGAANTSTEKVIPWAEHAIDPRLRLEPAAGRLSQQDLQALIDYGEHLFNARFTQLDGVGRPLATQAIIPSKRVRPPRTEFSRTAGLDANACSSCHHVPIVGGAGDFSANVFVSEGFVHSDFDSTDPQFSNERNTNHLFGAGLIELLAREMTRDLHALRQAALRQAKETQQPAVQALHSKGVDFGSLSATPDGIVDTKAVTGVDHDLVIRPFSHKGVMTSLRQFTINALNHHHGMQAQERFGARWTGDADHDGDGVAMEITDSDVSALVAWQATLRPPAIAQIADADWEQAASNGRLRFETIGCAECHKAYLPLESLDFHDPGPLDAAGTLRQHESVDHIYDLSLQAWADSLERDENGHFKVPLFGDLKRHTIADQQIASLGNELLSQRFVERNVFMTTELWGVGSTGPYGHRGNMTTLAEVIAAHGGQARAARDAWTDLDDQQKGEIIAWLKTLVIGLEP